MRACFLALFAVALAGCSAHVGESDLGDLQPSLSPRGANELSYFEQTQETAPVVALNELEPDIVFKSLAPEVTDGAPQPVPAKPVPRAQTARGSGDLARASDHVPAEVLTPSSAYAPPRQRVADRTLVKLAGYAPGTVVVRTAGTPSLPRAERRPGAALSGGSRQGGTRVGGIELHLQ